jgi:hypothetical protein
LFAIPLLKKLDPLHTKTGVQTGEQETCTDGGYAKDASKETESYLGSKSSRCTLTCVHDTTILHTLYCHYICVPLLHPTFPGFLSALTLSSREHEQDTWYHTTDSTQLPRSQQEMHWLAQGILRAFHKALKFTLKYNPSTTQTNSCTRTSLTRQRRTDWVFPPPVFISTEKHWKIPAQLQLIYSDWGVFYLILQSHCWFHWNGSLVSSENAVTRTLNSRTPTLSTTNFHNETVLLVYSLAASARHEARCDWLRSSDERTTQVPDCRYPQYRTSIPANLKMSLCGIQHYAMHTFGRGKGYA